MGPVASRCSPLTVSVACRADGQVHEVTDEAIAAGGAASRWYWQALCGHMVCPAPLVTPGGGACRRCASVLRPDQVAPSPKRR